jgi:acyl-CoA dehydrogenase
LDFNDSPEEAAFRTEVRTWLDANARRLADDEQSSGGVSGLLGAHTTEDEELVVVAAKAWQQKLYDAGWAGITWPKAFGGADLSPIQTVIFDEELERYDVPANIFGIGLGMIGPAIMYHGTDEQKSRYLPKMLSGEEVWCQLWSEPNAGSDVASLQTRAEPSGDEWVVNGQKVWTSGAQYSRFGLMIARTDLDAPKHRGITVFIVDMTAPGVDIRPLRQMTGAAHFNEVFLTDVRIADSNRVGDVNDGWRVAMTVLMNERMSAASAFNAQATIAPLVRLAQQTGAYEDGEVRQQLADLYIGAKLLTLTGNRTVTKIKKGGIPGPEGSISKLVWSDLMSDASARALSILGLRGAIDETWSESFLMAPGLHLGGGTDDIMRNIIGERVLGLPKEPSVDKDVPYRELRVGTQ